MKLFLARLRAVEPGPERRKKKGMQSGSVSGTCIDFVIQRRKEGTNQCGRGGDTEKKKHSLSRPPTRP